MTKTAKEMTAEELRGLENKFWAARKVAEVELREAEALAKKMAVAIAEKHGVPIDWDNVTYHPTTIDTWYTDPNNTKEQNEWMEEVIQENFYSVEPGDWWYPSRYC